MFDYFEEEKIKNRKLAGLKNSLNALERKLLYSNNSVYENYGQKELRLFEDKMRRTFIQYDINEYVNKSAQDLLKRLDKLNEKVMVYNG